MLLRLRFAEEGLRLRFNEKDQVVPGPVKLKAVRSHVLPGQQPGQARVVKCLCFKWGKDCRFLVRNLVSEVSGQLVSESVPINHTPSIMGPACGIRGLRRFPRELSPLASSISLFGFLAFLLFLLRLALLLFLVLILLVLALLAGLVLLRFPVPRFFCVISGTVRFRRQFT